MNTIKMNYFDEKYITKYILDYGFIMRLKGSSYFITAVKKYIQGEYMLQNIYYELSSQCNTDPQNIERCIRYFIKESFKNDTVKGLFPHFKTAPPIKEAVSIISNKIKIIF